MGGANTTSDSESDHRPNKSKKSRRKHYSSDDSIVKEAKDYLKEKLKEGNAEALQALAPSSSSDTSSDRSQEARRKKHNRKSKSSKHKSHRHPPPLFSPPPSSYPTLTEDDYFTRNPEFSLWLRQQKDIYFNDLDTATAHRLFTDFIYLWNKGLLSGKFYHSIDEKDADKDIKRHHDHHKTGFSWGLKPEIHRNTNATATVEDRRAVRKLERKQHKELLNELVPKAPAGTQEARAQAKAGRLEEKRMREESPDFGRLVDVMGGDDKNDPNSFARVKEREMARKAARDGKLAAKRAELEVKSSAERAKEEERMAGFRALISQSSAGGGLVIPKRSD
jgi:hypothetical protein